MGTENLPYLSNLKVKLVYPKKYETRMEAKRDIFEYIEIFCNRERLHSFFGYNSPEEYEKKTTVACRSTDFPFIGGRPSLKYLLRVSHYVILCSYFSPPFLILYFIKYSFYNIKGFACFFFRQNKRWM